MTRPLNIEVKTLAERWKVALLKQSRCPYKNAVLCVFVDLCVQSCLTLCNPMDYSPPGSSVHGIFKARILEQVAISFPGDFPNPGMELLSTCLLHWQVDSLKLSHLERPGFVQILIFDEKTRKYERVSHPVISKSLHLNDCSQPVSCIHGILWARTLKWVAIPFSRGFSWPRDQTCVSCTAGRVFTVWATREALHCWLTSPPNIWTNRLSGRKSNSN